MSSSFLSACRVRASEAAELMAVAPVGSSTTEAPVEQQRSAAARGLEFLLTTNAGLEQLSAEELLEAAARSDLSPPIRAADLTIRPWGCFGRVLLRRPPIASLAAEAGGSGSGRMCEPSLERVLLSLRCVHDVLWHHARLRLPTGADDVPLALYELIRRSPDACVVPPLDGGARSFRVSCVREGEHAFSSLDIEREVGGALHEIYGAAADMTAFDLRVRVDVAHDEVLVGSALNRQPLSRRHKLAFTRSVTLKPNVAHALLRLAQCAPGMCILDPCCGSGTIPLEAAQSFGIEAYGVDKSAAVCRGAIANAEAAGLQALCSFAPGNCRALDRSFAPHQFDAIVTNAPWGLVTGTGGGDLLEKIYRGLLLSCHPITKPAARLVVIVLRWSLMLDLARRSGLWTLQQALVVRTGALSPVALVFERLERDATRSSVREQLAELAGYFGKDTAGSAPGKLADLAPEGVPADDVTPEDTAPDLLS